MKFALVSIIFAFGIICSVSGYVQHPVAAEAAVHHAAGTPPHHHQQHHHNGDEHSGGNGGTIHFDDAGHGVGHGSAGIGAPVGSGKGLLSGHHDAGIENHAVASGHDGSHAHASVGHY